MSKHPREIVEEMNEKFDEELSKEWNYRHVVNADTVKNFITNQIINSHIETLEQEIERLENEKYEWLAPEEMEEHENCRYKKNNLYVGQVVGDNYNQALTHIISHLQQQLSEWRLMK